MKLVILDRDGTINVDSDEFIKSPEEWQPLAGSLEAIARLNHAGWHVAVASNQSGLGRGLFDVASLNAIHAKMHKAVSALGGRIDAVFYCPHSPDEGCRCRKPLPGLFEQIGERFGVDLSTVPVVGDTVRDIQAGAAVGCQPNLVLTGKGAAWRGKTLPAEFPEGTRVHENLLAFADWLVTKSAPPKPAV
ncbi:MAG TPA: D-glycero-beta-D-manno-heptose 1,7-bisphosphate 7-phosphatase [Ramlibacter sp.]|uniref:D-glycero-beta-D-manno-heptose 1,7-bisphosphate 7-phosphatase n=1 Tax=Ramlibacter sp. TaxID=1917967 RepID=UPI002BCF1576|nr:D-glycero-beta-D-manno-heptose 1,7-bisphosphate 7-phosphatase [Ramlibacter sp.]HVZ44089.1 D-glycero-beta-D-manno-heptose 1,7-bisphosphate 7-phosphatase [Ramlibacter sp.]